MWVNLLGFRIDGAYHGDKKNPDSNLSCGLPVHRKDSGVNPVEKSGMEG